MGVNNYQVPSEGVMYFHVHIIIIFHHLHTLHILGDLESKFWYGLLRIPPVSVPHCIASSVRTGQLMQKCTNSYFP